MVTYSNISRYYDLWSLGDKYFNVTRDFYVEESKRHQGPIVELGIGTARITAEILKIHKIQVIGVDICKEMLEEGKKRLEKDGFMDYVTLIQQDFTCLKLPQKSNYIYMPFRTFGHLANEENRKNALKAIYDNLTDGGVFIFDHYIVDEDWTKQAAGKTILMYSDENLTITDQYIFDLEHQKMNCKVSCNGDLLESFDFYWFEPNQIKRLIEEVGFHIKHVYGSFDRTELNSDSANQIWVLEK